LSVTEAPKVERIEHESILNLEAAAVKAVAAAGRFSRADAPEQSEDWSQLLIETDPDTGAVALGAVVVAEPDTIIAFRQPWRTRDVVDFGQRKNGLRQVRRVGFALLESSLEGESVLRVEHADHPRAVGHEAQRGVVHQ